MSRGFRDMGTRKYRSSSTDRSALREKWRRKPEPIKSRIERIHEFWFPLLEKHEKWSTPFSFLLLFCCFWRGLGLWFAFLLPGILARIALAIRIRLRLGLGHRRALLGVIRHVPARSFELHSRRGNHLLDFAPALRTFLHHRVRKALDALKAMAAFLALVFVEWHEHPKLRRYCVSKFYQALQLDPANTASEFRKASSASLICITLKRYRGGNHYSDDADTSDSSDEVSDGKSTNIRSV
jgi:hypothetical protein